MHYIQSSELTSEYPTYGTGHLFMFWKPIESNLQHECDTSATQVRHECYTNDTNATRVKKVNQVKGFRVLMVRFSITSALLLASSFLSSA